MLLRAALRSGDRAAAPGRGQGGPLLPGAHQGHAGVPVDRGHGAGGVLPPGRQAGRRGGRLYQALYESVPRGHPHGKQLTRLMLDAMWYCRRHGEFDESESRALKAPDGKYLDAKIMCVDPRSTSTGASPGWAARCCSPRPSRPRTFTPGNTGRERKKTATRSCPSPPPSRRRTSSPCSWSCPPGSAPGSSRCPRWRGRFTKWRRKDRQLHRVLPSHAYLGMAYERFREMYPDVRAVRQGGKMSESARAEFIAAFEPAPETSMVAFIALGGVFAEGVDLPGERLVGAASCRWPFPRSAGTGGHPGDHGRRRGRRLRLRLHLPRLPAGAPGRRARDPHRHRPGRGA
jgi:hypothetical protein